MTSTDARAAFPAGERPQVLVVTKQSVIDPKRSVSYELVDQPPSKNSSRWERVAGVICQGKRWQFKEYPFKVCRQDHVITLS